MATTWARFQFGKTRDIVKSKLARRQVVTRRKQFKLFVLCESFVLIVLFLAQIKIMFVMEKSSFPVFVSFLPRHALAKIKFSVKFKMTEFCFVDYLSL